MQEVAIVQRVLTHYRVPFFISLRERLASEGIRLRVIVGQPDSETAMKGDGGGISWAETTRNRYLKLGGRHVVWQPCISSLSTSDLVIVEQASRLLLNFLLLAWKPLGGPRIAFWGHGANLDRESASPIGEFAKRTFARRANWWFCYTEGTARIVNEFGVPPNRRTVVQNAVDTSSIINLRSTLTQAEIAAARSELGIGDGPVAVALGSIYPRKRPEFLIAAADEVRRELPTFELIVIGDGPSRAVIDQATRDRSWLHPVGTQTGDDMARCALLSSLIMNPGVVGLSVLDSFALGLPMVTCDLPSHGPEIEYLINGENGLMLPGTTTPQQFGRAVARLLQDHEQHEKLQSGAIEFASRYTVEEMVERFSLGIKAALESRS